MKEVVIPFALREGEDRESTPLYVRVPAQEGEGKVKNPVVILMTGLDGCQPDNMERTSEFLKRD
jgi:hypothetical protein